MAPACLAGSACCVIDGWLISSVALPMKKRPDVSAISASNGSRCTRRDAGHLIPSHPSDPTHLRPSRVCTPSLHSTPCNPGALRLIALPSRQPESRRQHRRDGSIHLDSDHVCSVPAVFTDSTEHSGMRFTPQESRQTRESGAFLQDLRQQQ